MWVDDGLDSPSRGGRRRDSNPRVNASTALARRGNNVTSLTPVSPPTYMVEFGPEAD